MNKFGKQESDEGKNHNHYGANNSLNLFERILRQNRRNSCADRKTFANKHDYPQRERKETLKERIEAKNTHEIVDSIVKAEIPVSDRLEMLRYLVENRSADITVVSEKLVSFSEELCRIYCSSKPSRNEELKILLPILKALRKLDLESRVLFENSNFVYDLMRACSTCVSAYLSKSKELRKMTVKKTLAGRVKSLGSVNFFKELSRTLGVPDTTDAYETESSKGIFLTENKLLHLFDTTEIDVEKDINKHIAEMHLPKFPDLNDNSELSEDFSEGVNPISVEKEEWADVQIAQVLPFGEILAYTKKEWINWLNLIDGEVMQFLKTSFDVKNVEGDQLSEIQIGTPVGFWTSDARFPGCNPSFDTRCLRGIALGKAPFDLIEGENVSWAIWAVDIGILTFCSKLKPLDKTLKDYAPLISLCSLDLGIKDPGKKEREFLLEAIPLLTELLASKPRAAKHIVAHDAGNYYSEEDRISNMDLMCVGGAFLMLIEYPDRAVRLEFLKLILSLARNSAEVLRYLVEFKFYLAVSTRLEICAHFCESATADSTFWLELRLLLQVLTAILYECEKFTNELPGMSYMQKVLIMLTNIEPYSMKFMAAKCHAILVNFVCDQPSIKDSKVEKSARRRTTEDTQRVKDRLSVNKRTPDLQSDRNPRKASGDKIPLESRDSPEPVLSVMDLKGSDEDDDVDDTYAEVPTANAVFDAKVKVDFYTKGCQVSISNGDTVELSSEKSALQISENNLAMFVCSFLNNGIGGTVFYGINANGIVEGIKFSRLDRDTFRKGIDRMMSRSIYPEVRPSCYDVSFIPVIRSGAKILALSAHRTWVIEIQIKALPHVVYTMASNHKCYVRQGTKCVEGMALTLRQDPAEQAKKEIEKAVQEFKAQIPVAKEKLVMFIGDYLRKTYTSEFESL